MTGVTFTMLSNGFEVDLNLSKSNAPKEYAGMYNAKQPIGVGNINFSLCIDILRNVNTK